MNGTLTAIAENLLQEVRHSPVLIGSGVLVVILLIAVIRVVFFSKRHRRRPHGHHWREMKKAGQEGKPSEVPSRDERRRRRRQRSRLNPTLAEKGGLPPARGQDINPPSV